MPYDDAVGFCLAPPGIQRRQYHLVLRRLETKDDLNSLRRFLAEYKTLEGYNEFYNNVTTAHSANGCTNGCKWYSQSRNIRWFDEMY